MAGFEIGTCHKPYLISYLLPIFLEYLVEAKTLTINNFCYFFLNTEFLHVAKVGF